MSKIGGYFRVFRYSRVLDERPLYVASDGLAYSRPNREKGYVIQWGHDGGLQTDDRTKERIRKEDCEVWDEVCSAWFDDRERMAETKELFSLPLDMQREIAKNPEHEFTYRRVCKSGAVTHYIFFPEVNRGGVCEGGNTEWTDCDSLDDLADRWATNRMVN